MPDQWDVVGVGGDAGAAHSAGDNGGSKTPVAKPADPWAVASAGDPNWSVKSVNGQPVGERSGFWSDFYTHTGGVTGLLKAPFTDSLPAELVKTYVHHPDDIRKYGVGAIPAVPAIEWFWKVRHFLQQPDHKSLPERMRDSFTDLAKEAHAHPGGVAGDLVKGVVADPELFFLPELSATKAASTASGLAKAAGASESVAAAAGKVAKGSAAAGTAASLGGGTEAIHELGEDEPLNPGAIGISSLIAIPAAAVQIPLPGRRGRLTAEEADNILKDTAAQGQPAPETKVTPTSEGYALTVAGGDPKNRRTFTTKAEAEEAGRELAATGSAYSVMDTVPRGTQTPSGERARFLHENPFTPEKMKEYVKRPAESTPKSGAELGRWWAKTATAAAVGAGLGAYLDRDDPGTGAGFGAAVSLLPRLLPKDRRISIEEAINTRNGLLAGMARRTFQFKSAIDAEVPEPLRRNAISLAMEKTPGVELNPSEQKVADSVRQWFDAMGATAQDAGVLKELLNDYVSHIVEDDPKAKQAGVIDRIVDVIMSRERPSPVSGRKFAQHRQYATFDELHQALRGSGLRIKTGDIGEIVAIYSKAMFKAITDRRLIEALKATPVEAMPAMLMPASALKGTAGGHPMIERAPIEGQFAESRPKLPAPGAPSPDTFEQGDTGPEAGPRALSARQDSRAVAARQGGQEAQPGPQGEGPPGGGFQLPPPEGPGAAARKFQQRPRNLLQPIDQADSNYVVMPNRQLAGLAVHKDIAPQLNFIFSARDPNDVTLGLMALNQASKRAIISFSMFHAKSLSDAFIGAMGTKALSGKKLVDAALNMYLKGGANDGVDALLKGGLNINVPEDAATDSLHGALNRIASVVDQQLPVSGVSQAVSSVAKFNDSMDRFTFAYLQTGFKLVTGLDALERLEKKGVPRQQAARLAASYANDIYGGLDWFRVANDVSSRIGRDVAYGFFNPNGRRWTQLLMFAPDWTFSTFRAAYKALPGAVDDPALTALHRRYLVKSALYYLTIANGINFITAGHSVFDNENPTRIQLADGRTMQFSKHFMEPFEWLRDPVQTADNKLAFVPRAAVELGTGKEYISAHDAAPDIQSRAKTISEMFFPISAQQGLAGGGAASVTGLVGMPIYGKTPEQKVEARKEKKLEQQAKKKRAAEYYRRQAHGTGGE